MGLESSSVIGNLVSSNPAGIDDLNNVDDHIRLIKKVLKEQFPGSGGDGFLATIVATEEEINRLQNVTSNIQTQLDLLSARITALGG